MSNTDKRNFVEERLRKQAEQQANEEMRESFLKVENDKFLRNMFENTSQIFYHEKEDKYQFSCRVNWYGDKDEFKEKIKKDLDKRADEIYEKLADELVDKLNNLEFLFQGDL